MFLCFFFIIWTFFSLSVFIRQCVEVCTFMPVSLLNWRSPLTSSKIDACEILIQVLIKAFPFVTLQIYKVENTQKDLEEATKGPQCWWVLPQSSVWKLKYAPGIPVWKAHHTQRLIQWFEILWQASTTMEIVAVVHQWKLSVIQVMVFKLKEASWLFFWSTWRHLAPYLKDL